MSTEVMLWQCPDCGLVMSRLELIPVAEGGSDWRCWSCGHQFGCILEGGTLDLGLTDG